MVMLTGLGSTDPSMAFGFKSSKCYYLEHVKTESSKRKKRKASSNDLRVILASQLKAINLLHSSPLHQLHLPVGSVWCNNMSRTNLFVKYVV